MGPAPDHGDDVARLHLAVAHADLVAGREDVGQHQDLLVAHPDGARVGGRVGEGNADQLGLGAVDRVPEDPAAAAEALPVGALAAVPAAAAGGDAGHEDAVADPHALHAGPDGLDGADGFMAEDPAVDDGGYVALEDVEVGAADGGRVYAHDGVGVIDEDGVRDLLPGLLTGTVEHECLHDRSFATTGAVGGLTVRPRAPAALGPKVRDPGGVQPCASSQASPKVRPS